MDTIVDIKVSVASLNQLHTNDTKHWLIIWLHVPFEPKDVFHLEQAVNVTHLFFNQAL